jgi:hypothetical protein
LPTRGRLGTSRPLQCILLYGDRARIIRVYYFKCVAFTPALRHVNIIYLFFVEWRRLDGRAVFPSPCCELLWGSSVLCHSGHALAKVCVRRLRQRDATATQARQPATMNFFSYAKTTAAHTYFMTTMMGPGICKKQDVATPVCRTRHRQAPRNSPISSDSMRATRTKTDATCVRRADQKTFF